MLKLNDVTYSFSSQAEPFLKNISLSIATGEHVYLLGKNGSGKTTLLQLILRIRQISAGVITFNDDNIDSLAQSAIARQISYVPQNFRITFGLKVQEFLQLSNAFLSTQEANSLLAWQDKLIECSNLGALLSQRIDQLSLGQQRKIGIIAALFLKPKLIILDEALSFLDIHESNLCRQLLTDYCKQDSASIFEVTHQSYQNLNGNNSVYELKNGTLLQLKSLPITNQESVHINA